MKPAADINGEHLIEALINGPTAVNFVAAILRSILGEISHVPLWARDRRSTRERTSGREGERGGRGGGERGGEGGKSGSVSWNKGSS